MIIRNVSRHPLRTAASVTGIALAAAILVVGFVFLDAMDGLITTQFFVAERQDVSVAFVEPRDRRAVHELARLPGVQLVEPQRRVAVRLRAAHRDRQVALTGVDPDVRLQRIVNADGRAIDPNLPGLAVSALLARTLGVEPGDRVQVEVLEGQRPIREVTVAALVDDVIGLSAYMPSADLHRLLREDEVASGAALLVDERDEPALIARLKATPGVAGTTVKRAALRNFRETLTANMNMSIFMNVFFAGIIACGVVYNAARVSLSERTRELASLRVLGFTRAEISAILLGELAVLTLAALPLGGLFGYGMAVAITQSLDTEVYRFPLVVSRSGIAWAFLTIIGAAAASGFMVRRRLDTLDLVAVLKIRE
jgi:putative ABC transport system permease protein